MNIGDRNAATNAISACTQNDTQISNLSFPDRGFLLCFMRFLIKACCELSLLVVTALR
jgi:hypothetical protein